MNQPEKLYHSSPSADVLGFEPRNEYPRYTGETKLVFATPRQEVAAMFLVPRDIDTEISIYGDRYVVFINSDEKSFIKQDKGGTIYTLPTESFETDSVHGMGEIEWYSKIPVMPLSKTTYQTSIEAMNKFGVDHFFVDNATIEKIRANPGDGLKLAELETL